MADYYYTTNGEVYTDFALGGWVPGLRLATLYYTRGRAVTFAGGEGAPIFDKAAHDKLKATTVGRAPTLGYAIELAAKQGGTRTATPTPPVETVPVPGTLPTLPPPTTYPATVAQSAYPYAPTLPATGGLTDQPWFWPALVVGGALVLYVAMTPPRSASSATTE
jgi:hypothetical protein